MAEKPEDQFSAAEKLEKAKELYARGCRNYYVKSYSDAADDLSEAAKLFSEEYGVDGDELGDCYLLYAKALIAVGRDENKLVDISEEESETEEAGENGEENGDQANGHEEDAPAEEETAAGPSGSNGSTTNGHGEEPQAGPSGTNGVDTEANEEDEGDDGSNLEVAWEVLQNAALIFERQGQRGLSNLLEVFIEMGGISIENGNFELAIKDFNRALDVFLDVDDANKRIAAEIHYKVGLCQSMIKQYEEAQKSFQSAADIFDEVIAAEKARDDKDEEVLASIAELEELQQEIINKITEIGETRAEEIEQVKKELAKLLGPAPVSTDGAGSSSAAAGSSGSTGSSAAEQKPKPTDISHLIKRKKPDSDAALESPAKKQLVETSPGEKIAVAVVPNNLPIVDEK